MIDGENREPRSEAWLRLVRRLGRRLRTELGPARLRVVHHPDYAAPPGPVSDPRRADRILHHLHREGLLSLRRVLAPATATLGQLTRVHDPAYLQSLADPVVIERLVPGVDATPGEVVRWQRRHVGGTILAVREALAHGGLTVSLGGGLHHAHADRGSGFCLLNDVAVAIADARARGFTGRVAVIDLDMHPGDGTQGICAADPDVFTLSLHGVDWAEPAVVAAAVADRNVALGPGVTDAAFAAALGDALPEAMATKPDLVIYVAGTDGAASDPLGNWLLSDDGMRDRDRAVVAAAGSTPLVWVLAGGYGADSWRLTARSLASELGCDDSIPTLRDGELARFREIAGRIANDELQAVPDDDLRITWADIYGDLGPVKHRRFLDFYTEWGLELALHEYGILDHVEALGFTRTDVEVDTNHDTGHLARLVATDRGQREILIEVVLHRSTDVVPGHELLYAEWMLLQNPRKQATAERPLLPGQTHPGLGCLDKLMGMLMMAAERLELEGLAFRPARYHVAAMARGWASFADPVVEARFAVMRQALEGLPLAAQSTAVATGRLWEGGEPLVWDAEPMVVPRSAALTATLGSAERQQAVDDAVTDLVFEVR